MRAYRKNHGTTHLVGGFFDEGSYYTGSPSDFKQLLYSMFIFNKHGGGGSRSLHRKKTNAAIKSAEMEQDMDRWFFRRGRYLGRLDRILVGNQTGLFLLFFNTFSA